MIVNIRAIVRGAVVDDSDYDLQRGQYIWLPGSDDNTGIMITAVNELEEFELDLHEGIGDGQ